MNFQSKVSLILSSLALITALIFFITLRNHDPSIFSHLWQTIRCIPIDCTAENVVQIKPADYNLTYAQYNNWLRYLILLLATLGILLSQTQPKMIRKNLINSLSTLLAYAAMSMLMASLYWIQ